ncbi:hypothetical protein AB0E63_07220 [Kribbella sp. NPDC026596]|uniref:hypothetical protein n=1 Tax=Kribbella sp. NPDC026596 TaxID=3155122 RepID=UPI0033E6BC2C
MTVMGEAPPAVWADEFRRTGRVVFPLRRRTVLWGLAQGLPPLVLMSVFWVPDALEAGGAERVSVQVLGVAYVMALGFGAWQLVTQRPAVTVDRAGIRRGRRKFVPWTEIGAIGIATGPVWARSLPIIAKDPWGKDLRLHQQNVRDMPALRRWLETLLEEHRRASNSGATTWQ